MNDLAGTSFLPCSKTVLLKALGEKRYSKFEVVMNDNKTFYASFKAAYPSLVSLVAKPKEIVPSGLLNEALEDFMSHLSNDAMLLQIGKLVASVRVLAETR